MLIAIMGAALGGCSTMKEMERKGFTTDLVLQEENEDWGQPHGVVDWPTKAKEMGVPVDARPLAVRNLRCGRMLGLYECDYLIDYGRNGRIEGTHKKRNELIGRDENGKWSVGWIVLVH